MRILIVEDNRHLNHELKMSLLHAGYAVDTAFEGEEGLALAEMTAYDALILDVMLPRKDGLAVCRSLRQQRLTMPILLLTAIWLKIACAVWIAAPTTIW
jgi:two-component system OmpR family response regulator